jgi:hypothetical protein
MMLSPRENDLTTKAVSCTRWAPLAGGPINSESWGGFRVSGDEMTDKDSMRFWSKVAPVGECLLWTGCLDSRGYGRIYSEVTKKGRRSHVVSFEIAYGPVPDGLEIDHLCRNRSCVSPAHLEAVDHRTNMLRGSGCFKRGATPSHCGAGHPRAEENTVLDNRGYRECRICRQQRASKDSAARTLRRNAARILK